MSFVAVGKKGNDFLRKNLNVVSTHIDIFDNLNIPNREYNPYINAFINEEFDKIEIVYNKFKNAATQIVTAEQFLPISEVEDKSNR